MSIGLIVTPVVGLPSAIGWAQVVRNHSGRLICAYAVTGQNAHSIGRDLADTITTAEPYNAVTLHQFLLDLLSQTRKANVTLQLAVILQIDQQLFVGAYHGQILYQRGDSVRALLTAEAEPQLLEGKVSPGVTVAALTAQLATSFSDDIQADLLSGLDIDTLVTTLMPKLHGVADSAQSAVAFVQAQQLTEATVTHQNLLGHSRLFKSDSTSPTNQIQAFGKTLLPLGKLLLLGTQKLGILLQKTGIAAGQLIVKLWKNGQAFWQQASPRQRKKLTVIAGCVVAIFILLIGAVGWYWHSRQTKTAVVLAAIAPSATLITEAESRIESDPLLARDKVNQAVTDLTALSQKYPKPGYLQQPIATELEKAKKLAESISGLSQLTELPVFFDLRLTEPNFIASKVVISDTVGLFADTERKQIIKLDLAKKQSSVLPLGELNTLVDLSANDEQLYTLGNGIQTSSITDTKSTTSLKDAGDSDRDATLMRSFSSYLYLLNPIKRNIFRFSIDKTKISEPIGWLLDKKDLDFAQLTSLAVDGDVWLTDKTGQIFKYTQGKRVSWQLTGLSTQPDSTLMVVTDDTLQNLYFLEPNRRRLLVVAKSGQLLRELSSPTLAAATGFGVSETQQKAFIISGSTVYSLEL
jgi:hypothetical protein